MANLLVISKYPDERLAHPDYTFVYLLTRELGRYFDSVYVVSPKPWVPRILAPLGRLVPTIRHALAKRNYRLGNVQVYFARYKPWAGRLAPERTVATIYEAVRRVLRDRRLSFDLVHTHMSPAGWMGVQVAKAYGVPAVLTSHENHDWLTRLIEGANPAIVTACVSGLSRAPLQAGQGRVDMNSWMRER